MVSKFSVRDNEKIISDIVKIYPDFTKIIIYHNSYKITYNDHKRLDDYKKSTDHEKLVQKAKTQVANSVKALNQDRALRRVKSVVNDIILCNNFGLFCTFTFDGAKHNRYDIDHCKKVMSVWLHNQKIRYPDLKYLIVPELHKDGAIHFHALFMNYDAKLKKLKQKTKNGRDMFNIPSWRAGKISSAVPMTENKEAVANYMLKQYITKDMLLFSGKKRYWCSKNLDRPKHIVNGVLDLGLSNIVRNTKPDYINGLYEIQYHRSRGVKFDKQLMLDLKLD